MAHDALLMRNCHAKSGDRQRSRHLHPFGQSGRCAQEGEVHGIAAWRLESTVMKKRRLGLRLARGLLAVLAILYAAAGTRSSRRFTSSREPVLTKCWDDTRRRTHCRRAWVALLAPSADSISRSTASAPAAAASFNSAICEWT